MSLEAISKSGDTAKLVHLLGPDSETWETSGISHEAVKWAKATGFGGKKGQLCLVPSSDGEIAAALFGLGKKPRPMDTGALARLLPQGDWRMADAAGDPHLAALGFVLGAYRFNRYATKGEQKARLSLTDSVDAKQLEAEVTAVFLARDLINTPASDMGPKELEKATRKLAKVHDAEVSVIKGDDLLEENFPMVHAVGRASTRAPRIIDMVWGSADRPKVTLVGKGVCFDTGGLNIKPGDSMSLMKKDMGGAANVLALASIIMDAGLPVRLRVIIGAVENSISGNAFRPGDVLHSRKGLTVEIGNTDAEGRLVLGDALALADEEEPEILIDMATLTGAARVALGPDLPAMFCDDDTFAGAISAAGDQVQDPVWRMPLWQGYKPNLKSQVADLNHISKGPFGGSITAALFLQHFVVKSRSWAHFDLYAWVAAQKPWAPVGGEAQAIRAIAKVLRDRYPA